ncbi:MAG: HPr family phosphocarrier protein [Phycisphaerales bacterium]|nr:MAG: HPr family phosphocarrier protein [Phycisphaerales bacterium]
MRTSVQVSIVNRLGLHARPAMALVDLANGHKCDVTIVKSDQTVNGKSIMEVMMLAATKGTSLEIICDGDDAQECCDKLKALIERGFDEE